MNLPPFVFWTIAALWFVTLVVFAPDSIRWYIARFRREPMRQREWSAPSSQVRLLGERPYDWERDEVRG